MGVPRRCIRCPAGRRPTGRVRSSGRRRRALRVGGGGRDRGVPERARREQQVLTRRVHRRALGGSRTAIPHETRQHEHRCALEPVDVRLHRGSHPRLRRIVDLPGTAVVAVGHPLRLPRPPRADTDHRFGFARDFAVGEHEKSERLTVRSTRCAAGREQHRAQRVRRHRLVAITADRTGGRQAFEQAEPVSRQGFEREVSHVTMIARRTGDPT